MTAEEYYTSGNALHARGDYEGAAGAFREAMALKPDYADACNNLAATLGGLGRLEEALPIFQRAAELAPHSAEALGNLGLALNRMGLLDEAILACQRAIECDGENAAAHSHLGIVYKNQGRVAEALVEFKKSVELGGDRVGTHSLYLNALLYHPACDGTAFLRAAAEWNHLYCRFPLPLHGNDRRADRPLRIGYVSGDLRYHSVVFFLLPLLQHHDRKSFSATCYSTTPRRDGVTDVVRGCCDGWRILAGMSEDEAAEVIRRDEIDILVDLTGHAGQRHLLIFARKPAPVQVSWLGSPASTGMTSMDWRVTDGKADPAGTDAFHTEKLCRVADTAWCFYPLSGSLEITESKRTCVVFGCFNEMAKINVPLLRAWRRILSGLPGSRLLLKNRAARSDYVRRFLREQLQEVGDRVDLLPVTATPEEHLRCYEMVDVALDTFPYHGTTTTCEALWMGVPVVSRGGDWHVSRVGVSLLESVGLSEFVARDEEEYVRIALRAAAETHGVDDRRKLRDRMKQSSLMDGARFAANIEAAYRQMWRQWLTR